MVLKEAPASAGDVRDLGSIPELGRSPGGGHVNPLQYSRLENPMDVRAWWPAVHRVTKSSFSDKEDKYIFIEYYLSGTV